MLSWARGLLCCLLALGLAGCGSRQDAALKKLVGKGYSLSVAEFVRAAREGDAQAVRWFVEAGVEPALADEAHHTALGEAVAGGKLPVVEALLSLGVKLPAAGEPSAGLLRSAVQGRHVEMLRFLIDRNVTAKNLPPEAASPLAEAARLGQREAVELLLPLSAGREQEALFAAAAGGDVAVLSLLIHAGASVLEPRHPEEKTALMLAAEAGHADAVELLFNAGSNRWVLDHDGKSARDFAQASGQPKVLALLTAEPSSEEREAGAPLAGATLVGSEAVDSLLIFRGCREEALPFILNSVEDGRTFFHLPSGQTEIVEAKGEVASSHWYLSRIDTEKVPSEWWHPSVILRHSLSGRRMIVVPGLPVRSGRMVAVLDCRSTKQVFEALPGNQFTLAAGAAPYEVDAVSPVKVTLHRSATPGEKITLAIGGQR